MSNEFIAYEQALDLKELGFDEPCFGYFIELRNPNEGILTIDKCENNIDGVLAPTFSQAFRWFREKYFMEGFVFMVDCVNKAYEYHIDFTDREDKELYTFEHIPQCFVSENHFSKYTEAELACLIKLIQISKTL